MHLSEKPLAFAAGAILLFAFGAPAQDTAQEPAQDPAQAPAKAPSAGKRLRLYDPATETSMKGTVEEVKQTTRGQRTGTHLVLKSGTDTIEVMLGPSRYISAKGFSFAKGDAVEVTGSKITRDGTDYLIARQIVKDGKTLTLRDKEGTPQWSRMGACPCPPSE